MVRVLSGSAILQSVFIANYLSSSLLSFYLVIRSFCIDP